MKYGVISLSALVGPEKIINARSDYLLKKSETELEETVGKINFVLRVNYPFISQESNQILASSKSIDSFDN